MLWAEGVKPKDVELSISFVQIKNLEDFKQAFDLILSHKPLQDEHPEWLDEIRRAIASKYVIEGMTRAQAFIVLGNPIKVEKGEREGKKTETWFPRQDLGPQGGWSNNGLITGFPVSVQFVDGKITTIVKPIDIEKVSIP